MHITEKLPGNQKALKFLLENAATLFIDDMQNELGKTPLKIACCNGGKSEELIMLLLESGANAKCKQDSIGYNAYDFLLQVKTKGFEPSSKLIEVLRVATTTND